MTIDIDAIRKREQAATPGPWHPHTTYPHTVWQGSMYDEDPGMISTTLAHEVVADAEFIAHARQDIPALLAELDKVRAQLADTHNRAHTDATNLQQILRDKTALANERDALKAELERANAAFSDACAELSERYAERDGLRTELAAQRTVIAAVRAWRESDDVQTVGLDEEGMDLVEAYDAYSAAGAEVAR